MLALFLPLKDKGEWPILNYATTQNNLKQPKTSWNEPYGDLKQAKTTQNEQKQPKLIKNKTKGDLKWAKTSQKET